MHKEWTEDLPGQTGSKQSATSLSGNDKLKRLRIASVKRELRMRKRLQAKNAMRTNANGQSDHPGENTSASMSKFDVFSHLLARTRVRNERPSIADWLFRGFASIAPLKLKQRMFIERSLFFDREWYHENNPDVAKAGLDPLDHFVRYGGREGRDPGVFFSTRGYQKMNPDIGDGELNPLYHFERYGWKEGRACFAAPEITEPPRETIRAHISQLKIKPMISVVMPVYKTPDKFLRAAINSIRSQLYENWELCVADDASNDADLTRALAEFASLDTRIKFVTRETNGNISAATNSALALAAGDFVALMDHDDLLHETALYEIAVEINAHPDVDIIYSDEDKIGEGGEHSDPYFKTDFDPELILGQNMVSHLGVYRRSLIEKIGGLTLGLEGSQDYDLALRAWAASSLDRIRHIPEILYHWRRNASTGSFSETQLERCTAAARQAIQSFLDGEGEGAKVIAAPMAPSYSRIKREIPAPAPLVSIIVPTKDRADLLSIVCRGVLEGTDYPSMELLIVDHESQKRETKLLFEKLLRDRRVRILPFSGQFNYSAMNNMAAREARGDILTLLNNDIEISEEGWLTEMVSHAVRPGVGAVGAKLLYPDGRVQHAGVVVGLGGVAGHAFSLSQRDDPGYFGLAALTRTVSAVTGACLVVRKSVYDEVGGLNEKDLTVAFNDVDFCLKVMSKGYRNVWTPFATLVHHESLSRGADNSPEKAARFSSECDYMMKNWAEMIARDPFYNENLDLREFDYRRRSPSRRRKPWADVTTSDAVS